MVSKSLHESERFVQLLSDKGLKYTFERKLLLDEILKLKAHFDAGLFYCPYVPLQVVRAVGQDNFQPKIAFKTRYGLVSNPFVYNPATGSADGQSLTARVNQYYRICRVDNLF
jgi:hypothetical protein